MKKTITRRAGSMFVPAGSVLKVTKHKDGSKTIDYVWERKRQRCQSVHMNGGQCLRREGHKGPHSRRWAFGERRGK